MNAPVPEGFQTPLPWAGRAGRAEPSGSAWVEEWIVVLEFSRAPDAPLFLISDVQSLIAHLQPWHPTALWNPDRYALQLRLPARTPDQAIQWAVAYHRDAAEAARLPPAVFDRVEILTLSDFERPWQAPGLTSPPGGEGLFRAELYAATRKLLAATTPAQVTETLVGFVTATGGRVERGSARHLPDTIDVDIHFGGDNACHAWAEALSVAGLAMEQFLPELFADAHHALARIQSQPLHHIPAAGTVLP
ncbi:MAG: hypothetical protein M3083_00990 [Actinomycetota bacterium]|nr:hypothetical protein [Actinomycetota bacterium]MDQ6947652.1 hypothetical protein [Actinomycetota bacterium]